MKLALSLIFAASFLICGYRLGYSRASDQIQDEHALNRRLFNSVQMCASWARGLDGNTTVKWHKRDGWREEWDGFVK